MDEQRKQESHDGWPAKTCNGSLYDFLVNSPFTKNSGSLVFPCIFGLDFPVSQ